MSEKSALKRFGDIYIRHAEAVGALLCVLPAVIGWLVTFALVEFRQVYLLRLGLSVVVGGMIGALANRYGVSLWLIKHRSSEGPATVPDGVLIGAAVGLAIGLVTPLTTLIRSNHLEDAKTFVIVGWMGAAVLGAVIGGLLASTWRETVDRAGPAA